jgi:hypothetical protein
VHVQRLVDTGCTSSTAGTGLHELINRRGLLALSRLTFSLNIDNPVKARPDQPPAGGSDSFGYTEHVFRAKPLRQRCAVRGQFRKTANVVGGGYPG